MTDNLLVSLVLNIGLLILAATVLAEFSPTRSLLSQRRRSAAMQLLIAVIFGGLGICSTYFGIEMMGAIVNTRVVSTVAAGLIGGPIAGIGAGLIAGIHRYLYQPEGFTALGCGIGTAVFGLIGAFFHRCLPSRKTRKGFLIGITVLSEIVQAIILFAVCRPFSAVLELEKAIFFPKIIINSFGMVLFFETFFQLIQNKRFEETQQQSMALFVADKCLPYLRNGLADKDSVRTAAELICSSTSYRQVAITDVTSVIAAAGGASHDMPEIARRCMNEQRTTAQLLPDEPEKPNGRIALASPLMQNGQPIGSIVLFEEQSRAAIAEADMRFLKALAGLFSTMLELSDLNRQIELRRMAEIRALQSQINPHFLYNALNTISSLCRTDPDQARNLILVLANYFRQTLSINEDFVPLANELSNVENYLVLARARFENAIHCETKLPDEIENCFLPPLLIQPLVENAVRHGATQVHDRRIHIVIEKTGEKMRFSIRDEGHGFPQEVLDALKDTSDTHYSGLFNVHRRLVSIYGPDSGLRINSSPQGSEVSFVIPAVPPRSARKEVSYENSSH